MTKQVEIRDPIEHRLEAIERRLEDLEIALWGVVVPKLNDLVPLVRTDHYGVGRGGIRDEP